MSSWIISKDVEFCYGHRVWSQTLDADYADNLMCACRHLHGHEAKVKVHLTADQLNHTGMVTDFRHLEWLKKWVNKYIDHQFIIDRKDPLYDRLLGSDHDLVPVYVPDTALVAGYNIDLGNIEPETPHYELYEGILVVDFVPTSEQLSAWMGKIVQAKMAKLGVEVWGVDWWETPKSVSSWRAGPQTPACCV